MPMENPNLTYKKELNFPGSVWFEYVGEVTKEEAMELQYSSGFHPSGYGFFGFKYENGVTKWNCLNSCD